MPYRTMGLIHARALQALRREEGQGTVEYVGIMLLLATVMGAVVVAAQNEDFDFTKKITDEIKSAIDSVVDAKD